METPNSLKATRAVDGDDWFVERLKVICTVKNIAYSQRLAYMVAVEVADHITVDGDYAVSTAGVTDDELQAAVTEVAEELGAVRDQPTIAEQIEALTVRVEALEPVPAWSEGVAYTAGDLVTYDGPTYTCVQPHTSQAGWIPSGLPALWRLT